MEEVLAQYRRIMDAIHTGGNIFYDKSRLEAYAMVAKLASDLRREVANETTLTK
jgi:hypothetical protein